MGHKTRVLFVCVANSARSQMAEALLRHIAPGQFEACSAGTLPGAGEYLAWDFEDRPAAAGPTPTGILCTRSTNASGCSCW